MPVRRWIPELTILFLALILTRNDNSDTDSYLISDAITTNLYFFFIYKD